MAVVLPDQIIVRVARENQRTIPSSLSISILFERAKIACEAVHMRACGVLAAVPLLRRDSTSGQMHLEDIRSGAFNEHRAANMAEF
jgi:hypothetical protein